MKTFFYRNWWLYYLLFFLLLGLFIYALLWRPDFSRYDTTIIELNRQLEDCRNSQVGLDTTANEPKADIPPGDTVNCDATVKSGGQGETVTQHELGFNAGNVVIDYEMQVVPDEITVFYDNNIVAQSNGLVRGEGRLQFIYNRKTGKPTFCSVKVSAPNTDTRWDYVLNCPQ